MEKTLMKYVVDIDGTICDKSDGSDYSSSVPKRDRIKVINQLYDDGHYIVYLTARGMGRYNNNAKLAEADLRYITELQLNEWGCKYHELFMGKPAGDVYIDDKGINANEFFRN
jgi:phosphatidate phosphatase PAH1